MQTLPLVLVHGAFADHHAFDAAMPRLASRGYRATAPDLPGHGGRAATGPITLATYVAAVADTVRDHAEPVVLVGHSMAGMAISQVAEELTERVAGVVYVAGYLPRNGDTLRALAETDGDSLVGRSMRFAPDYSTVTIAPDQVGAALCADVPLQVQQVIRDAQRPEPVAPFQDAVTLSDRFARVPKAYLHTASDRAVTPDLQRRMVAAYPGIATATIDTAHLPFVSRPDVFVEALEGLIARLATAQNR